MLLPGYILRFLKFLVDLTGFAKTAFTSFDGGKDWINIAVARGAGHIEG
jgi:hypothetical protein